MAMEVAGTRNWRRNSPARRPISPRCWPVGPRYWGWARDLREVMTAAVVQAGFFRRVRRVSGWIGIGLRCPFDQPWWGGFSESRRILSCCDEWMKDLEDCGKFSY